MAWVKLDDGFFRNPKAIAAGLDGRALYLASLCWSAANLTDGHVPKVVVPSIWADVDPSRDVDEIESSGDRDDIEIASSRARTAAVRRLLRVGLWDRNGTGYVIHDYLDYNPSRARTLADRDAARRRQARHRQDGES